MLLIFPETYVLLMFGIDYVNIETTDYLVFYLENKFFWNDIYRTDTPKANLPVRRGCLKSSLAVRK